MSLVIDIPEQASIEFKNHIKNLTQTHNINIFNVNIRVSASFCDALSRTINIPPNKRRKS